MGKKNVEEEDRIQETEWERTSFWILPSVF